MNRTLRGHQNVVGKSVMWLLATWILLICRASHSYGQIDPYIESWQTLRTELRNTIAPVANNVYEFRLLAREPQNAVGPKKQLEQFTITELPSRIVLVLGGLQGSNDCCQQFAQSLEKAMQFPSDTRVGVFEYPNDGSARTAGDAFKQLLTSIGTHSPKTKISIVAHSMGGLVARYAIESPRSTPNSEPSPCIVDQLIMICPPNQGSVLAQYADALEFSDALAKLQKGSDSFISFVTSLIDDGLGEACDELIPQSEFLREIGSYQRVPSVRYSIVAGTRGPISPFLRLAGAVALKAGRERAQSNDRKNIDDVLKRVEELLKSDELTKGLGDGAVSLRSAKLPGVNDFTTLPIHHAEWASFEQPAVQELLQIVSQKLTRP